MAGFVRYFTTFPGYDVIGDIESVNIVEIKPPSVTPGAGTGAVLLVGEFERGPVNTPREVYGGADILTRFGGLGHAVGSNPYAGPVAARSGGDEEWNGNGYIWLSRKRFSRLILCRVDNSAGSVSFTRNASLLGGEGPYSSSNGGTVQFLRNGATTVTGTITGTPGTITGDGFPGDTSQAWQVDVSGAPDFVDMTTEANDATDANLIPFPATEAVGDYFAVGRAYTTFSQITFDYANGTAGVGGTVVWEYWNGSSWTALSGVTDATSSFTTAVADGLVVSWTVPSDWARLSLNGVEAYYVRARCSVVWTTNPELDQLFVQGNNVTGFTGGEWIELRTAAGAPTRVVEFTSADQTVSQVVSRINATLALTIASVSGTQLVLSSEVSGGAGYIEIVDGTAVAELGLPVTAVQQVETWTVTNSTAGTYTVTIRLNVAGVLTDYAGTFVADGTETNEELRDAIFDELDDLDAPGITWSTSGTDAFLATADANVSFTIPAIVEPTPGDVVPSVTAAGVFLVGRGLGNVQDLTNISRAEAVAIFDALSGLGADSNPDNLLRVANTGTPTTGTLQVTGGTAYDDFGFDITTIADAADAEDITIPAGTRVQDSSATGTVWVVLEDVETGTEGGPWTALVRPFTDTDTAVASTAGNVTLVLDTLPDSFTVTNAATITRLSATQLDVRYEQALEATLDMNSEARRANIVASARASLRIASAVKENARAATASGLSARKYVIRPLLGTSISDAQSASGLGVANTLHSRTDRGVYCFPGVTTYVPEIATVGATNGGVGFTDDGVIQVGADSFYCSLRSQFRPEENVGQDLGETVGNIPVLSMEDRYNPEATDYGGTPLTLETYKAFKRSGICAVRIDVDVGAVFQSDVTCVDPATDRVLAPANRRYFADFVIDTMATIGKKYTKKMATTDRKTAVSVDTVSFFDVLLAKASPQAQRIANYQFTPNFTDATDALGIGVWDLKVKMLPTLESLLFNVQVGATVQIDLQ